MAAEVTRLAPVIIQHVTFGIQYEPHYAVADYLGAIVDEILRAPGTPFSPSVFPNTSTEPTDHTLLNPKTGDYLRVNQQDTILQLRIGDRNLERITKLAEEFQEFVVTPLRSFASLEGIVRYGMIIQLADAKQLLKTLPSARYLKDDFPNTRNLFMRFSQRLPAEEALVKKRVEDFGNVIYTISEPETGGASIALDYQKYFSPMLDSADWKSHPFPQFVEKGIRYFEGDFRHWLGQFIEVAEVA